MQKLLTFNSNFIANMPFESSLHYVGVQWIRILVCREVCGYPHTCSSTILNHVYALYCTLENVRLHSIHQSICNAHHMSSHPLRPGSLQHHHTSSLGGCTDVMSGTQTGCQHRSSPGEVQLQGRYTGHND